MTTNEPKPPTLGGAEQRKPSSGFGEDDFVEVEIPATSEPFRVEEKGKSHPDTVRRNLSLLILWFLLGTYALTIGAFVVSRFLPQDPALFEADELTAAVAAISGLQGLGAAVVGFYFGVKQEEARQSAS